MSESPTTGCILCPLRQLHKERARQTHGVVRVGVGSAVANPFHDRLDREVAAFRQAAPLGCGQGIGHLIARQIRTVNWCAGLLAP